jgi:hypothetical protein
VVKVGGCPITLMPCVVKVKDRPATPMLNEDRLDCFEDKEVVRTFLFQFLKSPPTVMPCVVKVGGCPITLMPCVVKVKDRPATPMLNEDRLDCFETFWKVLPWLSWSSYQH